MSMFRASPWVSYDPTPTSHHNRQRPMENDPSMEAPQISILRDDSPPILKTPKLTIRKKPIIKPPPAPEQEPVVEDQDDEEDQLIDDLEDDSVKPSPPSESSPKKKPAGKRKPRKSDKRPAEDAPAGASVPYLSTGTIEAPEGFETGSLDASTPSDAPPPAKKRKVSQKKAAPIPAPKPPKLKLSLSKPKSVIPPSLLEDSGVLSESYAGTAASSPVTAQPEQNSPEPEHLPPSSPPTTGPLAEDVPNLDNVPIPVYPLPTKPFPVQPPQKLPTGLAQPIPLDKSGKKVRHWREAKREIRGIAGGRWMARTWVGEKESELRSFLESNMTSKGADEKASASGGPPKHSGVSISAPPNLGKASKKTSKATSATTSAAPSRAPSAIPETQGPMVTSAPRAPTKMRILQMPPSEADDSDMAPPIEV